MCRQYVSSEKLSLNQKRTRVHGFTLLELLVVIAVVGVIASIGFFNGREALKHQEGKAAINTIRHLVWQGATGASARGATLELVRDGRKLHLRDKQNPSKVIRRGELPRDVKTNLPEGVSLTFLPPGKVAFGTTKRPFTVKANDKTYALNVSIVGEVKAEEVRQ